MGLWSWGTPPPAGGTLPARNVTPPAAGGRGGGGGDAGTRPRSGVPRLPRFSPAPRVERWWSVGGRCQPPVRFGTHPPSRRILHLKTVDEIVMRGSPERCFRFGADVERWP